MGGLRWHILYREKLSSARNVVLDLPFITNSPGSETTMKSPVCEMLGVEFPLFAFSHCRDVVAAVSRAGGFGVLGATRHTPASIEIELNWIDEHVDGKPYGLDVLIPENLATRGEKGVTARSLAARIPQEHLDFVADLLQRNNVPAPGDQIRDGAAPYDPD